ncbi:MAG: polymer-forming cytoskeletal protein, partial [Pirellulales bacterium]|nr:polymer-forming cytoskeletal protein [Pirellulales bacterium]
MFHRAALSALVLGLLALSPPAANAQDHDGVTISGTFEQERFVAGSEVRVEAARLHDLFAVGGEVVIDETAAVDIIAAAGVLRLEDVEVQDLIAAGGQVELDGAVHRDLIAVGGRVHQRPGSVIGGYAVLAGGLLDLRGRIDGNLTAAGGRVRLSGEVLGDAQISAGRLTIAPGARITGTLTYRGRAEPEISRDAVIGGIERIDVERFRAPLPALIGLGIVLWTVVVAALGVLGA